MEKTEHFELARTQFEGEFLTDSSFRNVLWQIIINEVRPVNSGKTAFTVVLSKALPGYLELGIVDFGNKGYTPTGAIFKERYYPLAMKLADKINAVLFNLSCDEATIITASTMRDYSPEHLEYLAETLQRQPRLNRRKSAGTI